MACDQTLENMWSSMEFQYDVFVLYGVFDSHLGSFHECAFINFRFRSQSFNFKKPVICIWKVIYQLIQFNDDAAVILGIYGHHVSTKYLEYKHFIGIYHINTKSSFRGVFSIRFFGLLSYTWYIRSSLDDLEYKHFIRIYQLRDDHMEHC